MPSLMNSAQYTQVQQSQNNIFDIIQRAKNDPLGFEQMVKQTNPEGYKRAMQIRNCANPKAMVLEMARAQGVNPNILSMLDLR